MPSNKPKIVAYTDEITLKKLKKIAEENERSVSQEITFLVKRLIKNYEEEYGEIEL